MSVSGWMFAALPFRRAGHGLQRIFKGRAIKMAEDGWFSNEAATFGDRVAAARDALGMSQSDLSKRLGVKLKTVKGWEDDVAEPRANKLQMLSGVLNVSLMWLLNGEGDGLEGPDGEVEIPGDIAALLIEMRELKGEMKASSDRMGRLEKRLRAALKSQLA